MLKIGIYCKDSAKRNLLKKGFNDYFNELKIDLQIIVIKSKSTILKNIMRKYMAFNIIICCEENSITYFKSIMVNHAVNKGFQAIGWLDYPLSAEEIEKVIFNEDYHLCPLGIYKHITKDSIRAVPYGDIEYCQWDNKKTIMYLKNGETEEISKSIKKLKNVLPEKFFATCMKGYIINFYNVKKIDRVNHEYVMGSGHKIPISHKKYTSLVSLYIKIMFGI